MVYVRFAVYQLPTQPHSLLFCPCTPPLACNSLAFNYGALCTEKLGYRSTRPSHSRKNLKETPRPQAAVSVSCHFGFREEDSAHIWRTRRHAKETACYAQGCFISRSDPVTSCTGISLYITLFRVEHMHARPKTIMASVPVSITVRYVGMPAFNSPPLVSCVELGILPSYQSGAHGKPIYC